MTGGGMRGAKFPYSRLPFSSHLWGAVPVDGAPFFYTGYTAGYTSRILWERPCKAALHKGFPHFPQGYPHMFM